jgi:hypothetical protein
MRIKLKLYLFLTVFISFYFNAPGQVKTGKITGVVLDRQNQQPVIGANVLIDGTKIGITTDTEGKFTLQKIEIGTYILKISCIGYKSLFATDIVVKTGQPVQLKLQMDEEAVKIGDGVLVQGSLFSIPKEVTTSVYGLNYEEIRRQAGATGDIHRIIQSMPGVVPSNDQRNDLIVRGGSPNENLTLVDNVEIPNLSHFGAQGASGGAISMLNTEFISEAGFLAGGFPAQFGGKLSSVLNVTLREGNRDNFASSFDLSMAGAGVIFESPLGEKGSIMLSVRRSYLDLLFGNFGMTAVPIYSNYQVKSQYILNPNNKIWFISIGGIDNIKFNYDENDTDDPETMNIESGGWRVISGLNWQTVFGKEGYGVLGISDAIDIFDQKAYDPKRQNQLSFQNQSREGETTIKYDLVYNFENAGQLNTGISSKFLRDHFIIKSPMGTRIPYDYTSSYIDTQFIDNRFNSLELSGYIQYTKSLFKELEVSAGIRYDYFEYINKKQVAAPRLSARYKFSSIFDFNISYGIYYQMPPLVFISAQPENKNMDPMRADHYIAGISYFPFPDIKITLETYIKNYSQYPVSTEYHTYSLANAGDEYSIAGRLRPLVSKGTGRSKGLEFYIQKKLIDHLYGQISYSYSKTEHEALDGILRSGSFDIPHVLSIIGGYKLNESWEFSAKFTYSTGRPYTPVDYKASVEQNRMIYDVQRTNSERMPDYSRLDIRVDHRANFAGWDLVSYIEIQNIYNRKNTFTYVYNEKTGKIMNIKQIAFFPVGGIKLEF